MFGIVRPCAHRLSPDLKAEWVAHLCGLCLALRADHGQLARIVTNYDGLIVSVLTDAQSRRSDLRRRTAGPCPLRGMRTASVARGAGARLAASVSLVLASAKIRDHVADGNGVLRRRPMAAAARRVAAGWDRAGARTGARLGFDTAVLVDAVDRQVGIERLARPGTPLTVITEPTETATAAAFAHTAVLAGRPGNAEPLAEAGRLFGRLAHLLDAVEDRAADAAEGAWNPLTATGAGLAEARRLCDDAVRGIRLALGDVEFTDAALVHALLVHELRRSVDRTFGTTSCSHVGEGTSGSYDGQGGAAYPGSPYSSNPYGGGPQGASAGGPYAAGRQHLNAPQAPYGGGPIQPGGPGGPGGHGGGHGHPPHGPKRPQAPRGFWAGCALAIGLCCTCKVCCASEFEGPWSGKKREGCCHACDGCGGDTGCSSSDCECCGSCCNGCNCCGDGGCCDGCCCCDGCDC
ncbi:hypothetical protein ADL22_06110 [Streptomyces sp. NRRL F-4489]|uniref:DUF5685 family protein n=1 Tax=Streptomyces sp. NRRL F-4489 TaxID=1609095 RepID=UPI00074A1CFF|nr:DUF5685 family protein [Streptomyces sp. NRRL F-4489]KUL51373.1 hypothetical protein ADL22_06110 [Streptomyces sp. NRRL F-4489]